MLLIGANRSHEAETWLHRALEHSGQGERLECSYNLALLHWMNEKHQAASQVWLAFTDRLMDEEELSQHLARIPYIAEDV